MAKQNIWQSVEKLVKEKGWYSSFHVFQTGQIANFQHQLTGREWLHRSVMEEEPG